MIITVTIDTDKDCTTCNGMGQVVNRTSSYEDKLSCSHCSGTGSLDAGKIVRLVRSTRTPKANVAQ